MKRVSREVICGLSQIRVISSGFPWARVQLSPVVDQRTGVVWILSYKYLAQFFSVDITVYIDAWSAANVTVGTV